MGFLCYVVGFLSWVIIDWLRGYWVYLVLFVILWWISHRAGMVARWNSNNMDFFYSIQSYKINAFLEIKWNNFSFFVLLKHGIL